jgi:hypothetical protein
MLAGMSDPFDEYLRELAGRERGGSGSPTGDPARGGGAPDADAPDDDPTEGDATTSAPDDGESDAESPPGDLGDPGDGAPDEEPTPLRRRRRRSRSAAGRGPGGPTDGAGAGGRFGGAGRAVAVVAVVFVLLLLFGFFGAILDLWTDAIWFDSVGYQSVFWTRIGTQIVLFLVAFVGILFLLGLDLWLAGRLAPPAGTGGDRLKGLFTRLNEAAASSQRSAGQFGRDRYTGAFGPFGPEARGPEARGTAGGAAIDVDMDIPDLVPIGRWVLFAVAVLAALTIASRLAGSWETILLWQHQVGYEVAGVAAVVDPVFGRNISFFLFDLPFLRLVQSLLNGILVAALLIALGRYILSAARGGLGFGTGPRLHLGLLTGLWLLSVAFGYQLDKLELSYSTSGVVAGVSYTDANARFLAFDALTVIAALTAAFLVASAFTRWIVPVALAVTVWFGASVALGVVYPEIVQRFVVAPNEYATQAPYIANNIAMTRISYRVDDWKPQPYQGDAPLTAAAVKLDAATFTNARLWDYRPLGDTLDQLQTVRQYYDFYDVDTDRYPLEGDIRQVMLSGREMALDKNPQALNWINERMVFTHGFGVAMVPVNAVDDQGLPKLIISNLPPVSTSGAPTVTEPRIYFGERPNGWIVTGARQPEFDFPVGDQTSGGEATTRWTGTTGIKIDSTFTRLLFALRFRDLNLLISDQITADSQLLMHRPLDERLPLIAPFLRYDKDPYLVVDADGRLSYIQDAYTTSDRFPAAQPFEQSSLPDGSGLAGDSFNYLRNSVKIVQDAYDGHLSFYVSDPSDPIIRAYEGVFPGLFKPLSEFPAALRPHIRWPEEIFNVQVRAFARYHVTNTQSFYNKDDLWTVPVNPAGATQQLPPEAYYVIMRMPGEPKPEFLLLQPMVPAQRPNMIAWIASRNSPSDYGTVRVYQFPRDTSTFGPTQIEARIDQDPVISSQITLWNQSGSQVIRGNLIVVPVGNSIVYLGPIYLQSTSSAFPQFTKIVVATSTTVEWADTLQEALDKVVANEPGASPSPSPSPAPSRSPGATPTPRPSAGPSPSAGPLPTDVSALIAYANLHFGLAQDALRAGDFATYGDEMKLVEAALADLSRLTGASPLPSAAPSPIVPTPLPSAATSPIVLPSAAPSASPAP